MSTTTREQLVEKCKRLMLEYGSRCSARMGDAAIRAVAGELRAAIEELAASTQAPEAKALDVVAQLDEEACTLLHGLMRDDGELSPITLHVGDGHSGRGLYASLTEYPDEGSVFLCAADAAASPEAPAAPKDHEIRELVNKLTEVARDYHATEQLRERIAGLVVPLARGVALTAPPSPAAPQGVQAEPVHWRAVLDEGQREQQLKTTLHVVGFRDRRAAEGWIAQELDFGGWKYTLEPLYAAPPSPPAVQPQPETLWNVTSNTPGKYIALYMVLNSEQLRAWRSEAAAKGIDYTDVVVEIDGVAASFTLDEFARRLGIGAPAPAVQPESTRYGSKQ